MALRERFNHHDAWFLGRSHLHPSQRLFGNANIGNLRLCSLQVTGALNPGDGVAAIDNWYARAVFRAPSDPSVEMVFNDIAHSTYVTIMLGHRMHWMSSLADLLRRQPLQAADPEMQIAAVSEEDRLLRDRDQAAALASAAGVEDAVALAVMQYMKGEENRQASIVANNLNITTGDVARVMRAMRAPANRLFVRERENTSVLVDCFHFGALERLVARVSDAIGNDREAHPPAVWIHLEGWTQRSSQ